MITYDSSAQVSKTHTPISESNSKLNKTEPTIEEGPSNTPKSSIGSSNRGLVFVHQPNDVVKCLIRVSTLVSVSALHTMVEVTDIDYSTELITANRSSI